MQKANPWLHRFAMLTVAATLCLIFVGGLVTTKDAGMSVPDWPTSFHYSMFSLPFAQWLSEDALQKGVLYEHSHRLFASMVGLLTTVIGVWILAKEPRKWVCWLGSAAFLLVVAQGVLGGLRVTHASLVLAMIHGCVAQAFLCVLVLLAAVLSPWWEEKGSTRSDLHGIRFTAWLMVGVVYLQLMIGATLRQMKVWYVMPTFPRSGPDGEWIPTTWNNDIAINFAHRVGAVVVTLVFLALLAQIRSSARKEGLLVRPAGLLVLLICVQIGLGASVILLGRPPTITTLHVVNGAAILATSFLIAIRASRLSAGNVQEADPSFASNLGRAQA